MIELHPYEYLTKMNAINSACNKANIKSYSSASRIKLPWKPFNIIKIPSVLLFLTLAFPKNIWLK